MKLKLKLTPELRRGVKRPMILLTISFGCLAAHYILIRAMAHEHIAHVLLAAGNGPPPMGPTTLAITLLIVRFLIVIVVPGLLLAAAAELLAYLLVGPKRASDPTDPFT